MQSRKLHCGRTIAPNAVSQSVPGWDFGAVQLFDGERPTFSDLDLPSSVWYGHLVGLLTSDTPSLFARELSWGRHLMLPAVICPLHLAENVENARIIRAHLLDDLSPPVLVRTPWTAEAWERWHRLRCLVGWDKRLQLCLEISTDAPDLERFLQEPV